MDMGVNKSILASIIVVGYRKKNLVLALEC